MKSKPLRTNRSLRASGVLVLAVILSGCRREGISVYQIAKEPDAASTSVPHSQAAVSAERPALQWQAPAHWKEAPPGEMRVGSFKIHGKDNQVADVSVIPLAGLAGGDLDNVNRWRGQVGMEPVTEADLPRLAEKISVDGSDGQLYDLDGRNPGSGDPMRVLAAVVRRGGTAWFFKMTGDGLLVATEKPAFVGFLKTVRFTVSGPNAGFAATPDELPPSHPPIGGVPGMTGTAQVPGVGQKRPTWKVPAAWKEVPAGPFLVAKFTIAGPDNSQAALNISMSAGDGGGLAGNVNRWRKQLGLPEAADTDVHQAVKTIDTLDGKASFVELSGTDARSGQKASMLAVIVPQDGRIWFYKLMGDVSLVERERNAFTTFVQTTKY